MSANINWLRAGYPGAERFGYIDIEYCRSSSDSSLNTEGVDAAVPLELLGSVNLAEPLLLPIPCNLLIEDHLFRTHEMLQLINLAVRQLVDIRKPIAWSAEMMDSTISRYEQVSLDEYVYRLPASTCGMSLVWVLNVETNKQLAGECSSGSESAMILYSGMVTNLAMSIFVRCTRWTSHPGFDIPLMERTHIAFSDGPQTGTRHVLKSSRRNGKLFVVSNNCKAGFPLSGKARNIRHSPNDVWLNSSPPALVVVREAYRLL